MAIGRQCDEVNVNCFVQRLLSLSRELDTSI